MIIKCLGSSSSGNAYIIEDSGEILLLESGVHLDELKKVLEFDFSKVVGCLCSHWHGDHIGYADKLSKYGISLYSGEETLERINAPKHRKNVVMANKKARIGGFTVIPFEAQHDVPCLGYWIKTPSGKVIFFATDTQYIKYTFSDIDVFMVECNYDIESIQRSVIDGIIPESVGERIQSTHFGFGDVIDFLDASHGKDAEVIMLLHLSGRNSNGERYKKKIVRRYGVETVIAENGIEWRDEI